MKLKSIDLNCDLGEYEKISQGQNDSHIMSLISSCNIACGFHAGNQAVIEHTVKLALSHGVNIGAHPSFPDRVNFGRLPMHMSDREFRPIMIEQIQCLKSATVTQGGLLSHVKPHGALYNQAAVDSDLAILLLETVAEVDSNLMFYGLAHSEMEQAAKQVGIRFIAEGFADRAYTQNRTLVPRSQSGAVVDDMKEVLDRVLVMLNQQKMVAINGELIELEIGTLCLHGDHQSAVNTALELSAGLLSAGYSIKPPG